MPRITAVFILNALVLVSLALIFGVFQGSQGSNVATTQSKASVPDESHIVTSEVSSFTEVSTYSRTSLPIPTTAAEEIPLFSDAQVVRSEESRNRRLVVLESAASLQELVAFYNEALDAVGWSPRIFPTKQMVECGNTSRTSLVTSNSNDDLTNGVLYDWVDPTDQLPYKLTMWAVISDNLSGKREVRLIVNRAPYVSRMPIHPGAYDVTIIHRDFDGITCRVERIINYSANSSPEDLLRYYSEVLPQQGWVNYEKQPFILEFGYSEGGVDGCLGVEPTDSWPTCIGGTIVISKDNADPGKSAVEIRVSGSGVLSTNK